ncbi:MAG: DUF4783 domain-containing protein [Paludibacteraceae bacterium]|nr:DUF4783 domain-containing protein [Paludibacteraceae bacterium]MBR2260672.1 DUF4783 domain-containing protein [Paludibacteraceae bacterium]
MRNRKSKIFILSFFTLMFGMNSMANPTEITQAFANGNISKLESYLNNNVDVMIENSASSCDKNRAKSLLSDFFRKNRPTNYSLTNKTEKGKSAILLGKLYTSNGEFSLFILTQKDTNKDFIYQIKITKSN